jgi:hypothetical protein
VRTIDVRQTHRKDGYGERMKAVWNAYKIEINENQTSVNYHDI